MKRREFFQLAAVTGSALTLSSTASLAAESSEETDESCSVIDTNVSLFEWPFRQLPLNTPQKLVQKLQSLGVVSAWAGSYEGIWQRDLSAANQRLASACATHPELTPIGTINPMLAGWEADLRQCAEVFQMPGIRLFPSYHKYTLDNSLFLNVLQEATRYELFVQITTALEDLRTQPELMRVPDVDLNPLVAGARSVPESQIQILNARPRADLLKKLADVPGIYWDISRVDGTTGVPQLMESTPEGRVLFGSHAPFLIPEAALIRVHESNLLTPADLQAVYRENAQQFLKGNPA